MYSFQKPSQRNLLFLSDFHGSDLSETISWYSGCAVQTVFKPNARLCCLTHDIEDRTMFFSKRDVVVVIGGSNDVDMSCNIGDLVRTFKIVMEKTVHTNLIVALIPLKRDNPKLNFKLVNINKMIESTVNRFGHTILLHLEKSPEYFFAKDGIQFNAVGKECIGKWISDMACFFDKIQYSISDSRASYYTQTYSLNGTFLQSQTVLPERETALNDGDIIGLGVDPTVCDLDSENPPDSEYIFKITRKLLSKDELAAHDQDTVVPILAGQSYSYNNPSRRNINKPSTSSCGTSFKKNKEKTLEINSPKNVEPPQNIPNENKIEVVELVDSDDEGDVIKSVKEKITSDKPITVPDIEPNSTPNNIITIDSDADVYGLEVVEKESLNQEDELVDRDDVGDVIKSVEENMTSDKPVTVPDIEPNSTPNNIITIDSDGDVYGLEVVEKVSLNQEDQLGDSDDVGDVIKSVEEKITSDKPITVPDIEPNSTPNNIITIDSDADVHGLEVVEKVSLNQEDTVSKMNDNNVENIENCDISDEDILKIKEVESAYHMNVADDISEINNKNDFALENCCSTLPAGVDNISLSSDSSVKSEKSKMDKLVNENGGVCVQEEIDLPDDAQSDKKDQNVKKFEDHNNKEPCSLEIKEEETRLIDSYTVDDDIILIEDDDGELPCSQLFDMNCAEDPADAENVEESSLDNEKNVETECWQDIEEIIDSDSDSDSDAEQWFQRLSQSHEPDSEEDEEKDENRDKSYAVNDSDDELPCKDDSEKFVHPEENQTFDRRMSEEEYEVIDTCDSQLSERIPKEILSGSKRKHSVSSEEDLEDTHEKVARVTELSERHVKENCDPGENSVSLSNKKKFSDSFQNSAEDSKMEEISKRSVSCRIPNESNESSYSSTKIKKLKKSDESEKTSLTASHAIPAHKRHRSQTKSEESDESSCSSTASKRYKKNDNINKKSSHPLSDDITDSISSVSNKYEKHPSRKHKQKRKLSTDTDSSKSSDTYSYNRETIKDYVHSTSTSGSKDSGDDSESEWYITCKNTCEVFTAVHRKIPHTPPLEDQAVSNRTNLMTNEIEDGYIFDDIEDKIKPSKIIKFKQQVSLNTNEREKSSNACVNLDETDNYLETAVSVDKQPQDKIALKTCMSSAKTDNYEESALSVGKPSLDKIASKTSASSAATENCEESDMSIAKKTLDKEYPVAKGTKLTEVRKKINASHKKKTIPIIEAKSIRTGRKSVTSESEKKDPQVHENKHEQWLSSNKASKNTQQPVSKADAKAYRKERLKDLAMKEALENKQHEKPKTFTAKNKTKTTTKSRNDMFLQDLVSSDSAVGEKSDKVQKDAPLASYKIPRRASSTEDHLQTTEASTSSLKESKPAVELKPTKTPQHTPIAKSSTKPVSVKSKIPNPISKCETTNSSVIDQILKSTKGKSINNTLKSRQSQVKTSVGGVENEEPTNVVYLKEEDYHRMFQGNNCHPSSKHKSIIKQSPTPRDNKKKIKFNLPNDENNIVYVSVREFEVAENCNLKPITKSVSKEYMKVKKPSLRKAEDPQYKNYREETLYIICNWNCTWFEEKNVFKNVCNGNQKDPPVFEGQIYHLTGEFTDYRDYRRGIFPLLMYELWGSVSKQYDQVYVKQNNRTNPLFNIEIRGAETKEVSNNFFPPVKKQALLHLQCQVLLDKKQQDVWPRVGDLVVLSLIFKEAVRKASDGKFQKLKEGEKRIFGYVSDCPPPKPVNIHPDVSPRLRQQCPNANMVMEGLNIIIKGNRGQPIDMKQGARFKVLKNIKPDLRAFEAVDRLAISPLCKQVFQPRWNSLDTHNTTVDQTAQPLVNHLNPSQKKAVMTIARECIQDTSMIHLVHGPPGCGKSEVIVNIILQMWYDWHNTYRTSGGFQQILLCAPSNSAVDDIVNKLVTSRDAFLNVKGIPKFELIRVGLPQSTHESSSHLTLDYLTKMELKRLREVKEDENQKRIEIQCLEARKHQLSQKLDSLTNRRRNMATLPNPAHDKMSKEIRDVEKKLADTIAKISYFESGKQLFEVVLLLKVGASSVCLHTRHLIFKRGGEPEFLFISSSVGSFGLDINSLVYVSLPTDKEPDGKEMASKYKEMQLELLQKANIVATTLSSCYNGIMSEAYSKRFIRFDCCIVDEATQCVEPDTLIPLMLGVKKLVLVGDPKQLPATVVTSTSKAHGLEKSLFARHYDWWRKQQREMNAPEIPCHFLNIQYRMHPEIARWPSEHFYESRLLSLESLRDRSNSCPLVPYVVLSHSHQQNAHEGECNTEEGRIVANLVRGIASHPQCQGLSVGVITPYNRQKDDLKRRINLREFPNLEIGTVDSYQGRERDVVIFSCVRTEGVGFLGGPERLNVALTRAKHSLIVVGNFMSLQRDQTWNSLLNNARNRNVFKPIVNNHTVCSLIFRPGLGGGNL